MYVCTSYTTHHTPYSILHTHSHPLNVGWLDTTHTHTHEEHTYYLYKCTGKNKCKENILCKHAFSSNCIRKQLRDLCWYNALVALAFWSSDIGHWPLDTGHWTLDTRLWTEDTRTAKVWRWHAWDSIARLGFVATCESVKIPQGCLACIIACDLFGLRWQIESEMLSINLSGTL